MLILIGESASGKSTIEKALCENFGYEKVTSYTTRSPRENEVNGIDYHYISEQEFLEKKKNGFFAEVGEYNGWYYGSAAKDCTDNKVAVLTPHGLRQLKKRKDINVVSFYIKVPRRDRLIKILQRNDNIEEAKRRDSSDLGQFDGIEDEVDFVMENKKYRYTPKIMATLVHNEYRKSKTNINKVETILCDIDEVVNDLISKLIPKYNEKYDDTLEYNNITNWEIKKFIKPKCVNIFEEFCTDSFLSKLEMQPKAKEVIGKLLEKYNFYFLTSTHPNNIKAKDEWLKRNIPQYKSENLIMCKNKHLVCGDILIDDCLSNFKLDQSPDSLVKYNIIFDKPWNRTVNEDNVKNFRVYNWEEIEKLIHKLGDGDNESN